MQVPMKNLHMTAGHDGRWWRSYPPHVPGECRGRYGADCPEAPDEPCQHKHGSSRTALACSARRQPFNRP